MKNHLYTIRVLTVLVIVGLVISGLTAFPLLYELNLLARYFADPSGNLDPSAYTGVAHWILLVRQGLEQTYSAYPFIAYGTDWLAFGHIVIALFFVLAFRDPIRYEGVYWVGVWASVLVIPLAFICGPIRGIPFFWRMLDCMFGIVAMVLLFRILSLIRKVKIEES